jgi:hypothetical protein
MFKVTCLADPKEKLGLLEGLFLEILKERLGCSVT